MGTISGVQITDILGTLQRFFSEKIAMCIEKTKLVERERRLSGKTFIEICFWSVLTHGLRGKLRNFCQRASSEYGIGDLAEESFNGRFNDKSVACSKAIFEAVLCEQFGNKGLTKCLPLFSHIFVEDSSVVKLPNSLSEQYPGTGGSGNAAMVKLEVLMDLKESADLDIKLKKGRDNDCQEMPEVQANSLYLRDLGYFKLACLSEIAAKGAFYVSRIKVSTCVYTLSEGGYQEWDLVKYSQLMRENEEKDCEVYIGKKEKMKVRLVLKKLPAAVAAERRRKLKSCPRNKRKNPSKQQLAYCDFSVVITNLSCERFTCTQIYDLYRLRWQIELLFKAWKSYWKVGDMHKVMKPERVLTLMYLLLTTVVLSHKLISRECAYLWNEATVELSRMKAYAILAEHNDLLIKAITRHELADYQHYWTTVAHDLRAFGEKQVKDKKRKWSTLFSFE